MIALKNVTKIYQMGNTKVQALVNVNLEIEADNFFAIMGPSGSGKSTLLYTIGALLTPTQGDVMIDSKSIYTTTPRQRARFRRENIGFIFQTFELIPYLTALENVMLPLYLSGLSQPKQEKLACKALQEVGLANRMAHKPNELSGGEQQRVSVARGIVNTPSILLADEPTGNLDQETGSEIMDLLKKFSSKENLTVIMVTHDPDIARRTDLVLTMVDGQIFKKEGVHPKGGE